MGIGNCIEIALSTIARPRYRASIFLCYKFVSLKIVVHILFAINAVYPKDLDAMQCQMSFPVMQWSILKIEIRCNFYFLKTKVDQEW